MAKHTASLPATDTQTQQPGATSEARSGLISNAMSNFDNTVNPDDSSNECFLFEIAQALQDMIFGLAYPGTGKNLRLVSKKAWEHRDDRKYPGNRIESFVVSKAFFEQATAAWVWTSYFATGYKSIVEYTAEFPGPWLPLLSSELLKSIVSLAIMDSDIFSRVLDAFPQLKRVRVQIHSCACSTLYDHKWSDEEFMQEVAYENALHLRGLEDIEFFLFVVWHGNGSPPACMAENLKRLRELVLPTVTQDRTSSSSARPSYDELLQGVEQKRNEEEEMRRRNPFGSDRPAARYTASQRDGWVSHRF